MSDDDLTPENGAETDESATTEQTADETTSPPRVAGQRSGTAAAQAASRARRIGGRPLPGPRPAADEDEAASDVATDTEDEAPAPKAKPDKPPKVKTAKVAKDAKPAKPKASAKAKSTADASAADLVSRLGWIPAYIAGVLLVAMLSISVWQSHGVWWDKSSSTSTSSSNIDVSSKVLAAAKDCTVKLSSYDYRNLSASEAAGLTCTTGEFTTQYKSAMEQSIPPLAKQSLTVQTTQIAKAGIQSVSPNGKQWVILIYGQQTVTNKDTGTQNPRLDILSVQVTLDEVGDKWLVSSIRKVS